MFDLESQIRKWRRHVQSATSLGVQDVEELETHLRDSVDELMAKCVGEEEAFLVSLRRLGAAGALSQELLLVVVLIVLAGLLGKVPAFFGVGLVEEHPLVYARNAPLVAFAPVAIYLIWRRGLPVRYIALAVIAFGTAALAVNLYPSLGPEDTAILTAIHLPIALLLPLLVLYGGPGWRRGLHLLRSHWSRRHGAPRPCDVHVLLPRRRHSRIPDELGRALRRPWDCNRCGLPR